jgi:hypothetical protein
MGRSFIRQDAQIRNSTTYTDSTAPSLANFETNAGTIEGDLNNLRSQCHNLLKNQAGNWYDDLNTPSALESGSQRGVNDINTDLHAVEKKRVLRDVLKIGVDITVPSEVLATGTLTFGSNPSDTQTVTTGTKTYTFQTSLTDVDGNVLIGATASDSLDNLIAAINLAAGAGTTYAASTTSNGFVSAAAGAGDTMDATALLGGTVGNLIATTDTVTGNPNWGATTLTGGAGDLVILGAGELPGNTTAAVGSVTTLGTVCAYDASFTNASLEEVAGGHALNPANRIHIIHGSTGDPILSDGRKVYGLMQCETVTDGHTITDSTTTRAKIQFVRANSAYSDLELVPSADIEGAVINMFTRERVRWEDLNEYDFLSEITVDVGSGSGTVDRQTAYTNQGTTAVNLNTNATLDLEGAGLVWKIRDDLEADLFVITEGSAGGTSEVAIESDTDVFRGDAILNDFDNGIKVDTGAAGTTINIGVTANQIDCGGALEVASGGSGDLRLEAAGEVLLDDTNFQNEATWSQAGVKVTETQAEITAYETNFGGEVSLFNAINQAFSRSGRSKGQAILQNNVAANTDVDATTSSNLDADLPDYSGVGTFVDDVDVYLNGELLRNGADAAANEDVYPGSTPAQGMLKFEFALYGTGSKPDQLSMIVWSS